MWRRSFFEASSSCGKGSRGRNSVPCLTEFECSIYADGELPEGRTHEVARHLESCGKCRRLADALRNERRVLVSSFQDVQFIEFELDDEALGEPQVQRLGAAK